MIAAIGDTAYNIVLLLHIATAFVAFAPAFVHPILANQAKSLDDAGYRSVMGHIAANGRRVYTPALLLTGLLGFGLQGMSDGVWEFSQAWMIWSIIVWIAINGLLHGLVLPGERALAAGDDTAEQKVTIGGGLATVLLIVMLYLMIWKPGF